MPWGFLRALFLFHEDAALIGHLENLQKAKFILGLVEGDIFFKERVSLRLTSINLQLSPENISVYFI